MNILVLGDIFGKPGKIAVHHGLPQLIETYEPDFIIANAQNIAGGFGVTDNLCSKLFRYGVNIITTGNHIWDRQETIKFLDGEPRIVRPINFPPGTPGKGSVLLPAANGALVGVINAQGRVYMRAIDCPFRVTLEEVEKMREKTPVIIVDFHAEATSEKVAMAHFLDGRVTAVLGTHTHIQTNDFRILPGGTAAVTDIGMTGPHDSVIGVKSDLALEFLISGRNVKFSPAEGDVRIQGAFIRVDPLSGVAEDIEQINMKIETEGIIDD
jgi:2',3'-cyclic-nucleotide 2'-phosphodiesterase